MESVAVFLVREKTQRIPGVTLIYGRVDVGEGHLERSRGKGRD